MRAVNLLPRDEQRERLQSARTSLFIAGGGVIVATAFAMFLASSASGDASDSRAELQAVETEIANLPKVADAVVTHGAIVRSARIEQRRSPLRSRREFPSIASCGEISFVLPGDAWLTQLDAIAPARRRSGGRRRRAAAADLDDDAGGSVHRGCDLLARLRCPRSGAAEHRPVSRERPAHLERPRRAAEGVANGDGAAESQGPRKPFVTFIVTASLRTGAGR